MIEALAPEASVPERLSYVGEALAILKRELAGKTALLGFGGSPWTLATYMVEGGSSEDFARVKALFYEDRAAFDLLLGKLTAALIAYFRMQIKAGADAIQIFDSWGGRRRGPGLRGGVAQVDPGHHRGDARGLPHDHLRQGHERAPRRPGIHGRPGAERRRLERAGLGPPEPSRERSRCRATWIP